jgi:hypothetical protein
MSCTCLIYLLESGVVVSVITVCAHAPNWSKAALYGTCWGFNRAGCWYLSSALLM